MPELKDNETAALKRAALMLDKLSEALLELGTESELLARLLIAATPEVIREAFDGSY